METRSNTTLAKKLGLKNGDTLWLHHAPSHFTLDVPPNVAIRRRRGARAEVVVAFFTHAATLATEINELSLAVFPAASLWIAWPKRASHVETDLSDHVVRELALPLGLVDNKVCAVDETWSGLRLVWRVGHRVDSVRSTRS
jgi:hypothetical protein